MANMKYELEKHILTYPAIIENIDLTVTEDIRLFDEDKTFESEYADKVELIKLSLLSYIEKKDILTGKEAVALIKNMNWIIKRLTEQTAIAETLYSNGHSFVEMLETLLEVTREHIANYEEASKQLIGKRSVFVIVDGNNNNLPKPIQIEITDNIVTIEKCRDIVEKIKELGHAPQKIEIYLNIYTQTKGNECGDFPEECLLNKQIKYFPKEDYLQIWENHKLVKEI